MQKSAYGQENAICPVSSLLSQHASSSEEAPRYHSYPMDIFDPEQYSKLNSRDSHKLYSCIGHEKVQYTRHNCSLWTRCPLRPQNILDAQRAVTTNTLDTQGWSTKTSFCSAYSTLHNVAGAAGNHTRIVILGGSVTGGTYAGGCCCVKEVDRRCTLSAKINTICALDNQKGICSWSEHFKRWANAVFGDRVSVILICGGGCHSLCMSNDLLVKFQEKGIRTLTSSDIVLIDHSVNDGETWRLKSQVPILEHALSSLIRKIYHASTEGSWPTVVLLEHWPFPSGMNERIKNATDIPPGSVDYSTMYSTIAARFELPVWSYKDVVWSRFVENDPVQSKFRRYLLFLNNRLKKYGMDSHPPFYVHLFYADLIAALLLSEFQRCAVLVRGKGTLDNSVLCRNETGQKSHSPSTKAVESRPYSNRSNVSNDVSSSAAFCDSVATHMHMHRQRLREEMTVASLPVESNPSFNRECDPSYPPVISISALSVLHEQPSNRSDSRSQGQEGELPKETNHSSVGVGNLSHVDPHIHLLQEPLSRTDEKSVVVKVGDVVIKNNAKSAQSQQKHGKGEGKGEVEGWVLYEDRPGKAGWIIERTSTVMPASASASTTSTPIKVPPQHTIEFRGQLSISTAKGRGNGTTVSANSNDYHYLLMITYLRTYENAGTADVMVCGRSYGVLDALWSDYHTYHISINDYAYWPLPDLFKTCPMKNGKVEVTVNIKHRLLSSADTDTSKEKLKERAARGNEKFKLVGVRVC